MFDNGLMELEEFLFAFIAFHEVTSWKFAGGTFQKTP